ncbi:MAG: hypothetical protein IIZ33_02850 [Erysipelotrichaceae bacterium]|nr:hypothetical protein [Erysipelotrichaceae bacterium]
MEMKILYPAQIDHGPRLKDELPADKRQRVRLSLIEEAQFVICPFQFIGKQEHFPQLHELYLLLHLKILILIEAAGPKDRKTHRQESDQDDQCQQVSKAAHLPIHTFRMAGSHGRSSQVSPPSSPRSFL